MSFRNQKPEDSYLSGCYYPIVEALGMCCGADPCDLEWHRPCGSCWDFSTCGDCAEPVWPGRSSDMWARPEFPGMMV